jgi:hypothetical protein
MYIQKSKLGQSPEKIYSLPLQKKKPSDNLCNPGTYPTLQNILFGLETIQHMLEHIN